jgi:NodT family efflux transporter outer membrane factor (OMF) lipoprotein
VNQRAALLAAVCVIFLAGCTVGPKYSKPSVPMTPSFKETPPPATAQQSGNWKPAQSGETGLPGKWWEIFSEPRLNELEEQISPSNLDLKVAEARFREARAAVHYNRASLYPSLSTAPYINSLSSSAHRPFFSQLNTQSTGDFYLPFDLSYEIDFWGRVRRNISASREAAQASAGDLATLSLSLHSELAIDYFELHTLDAQQQILNDTVKAYTEALRLTTNRYEGGVAARQEVAQAQTQLDTTRAQATDVGVLRSQYEHAIAILIGQPPALFSMPVQPLQATPPSIPAGLPSALLERRPDIAAAERRVAEANDQIGIARAAYFPTVTLGAAAGFEGTSLLNWFSWPARFWAVGPNVAQVIYDGGRRRANMQSAEANYDATVATYRQTTLTAFQQVEDNLAALRVLDQEAKQQRDAVLSSQNLLALSMSRYKGGVDTYLQVITSQTINLTNQETEIDIMRRRMDASVLLVKALGGGWTTAQLPAVSTLR